MANVDITTLAISVTSTGIAEAATNLEALSKAASNVENKTSTLKSAFGGLSASQAKQADNIEKLLQKMQRQSDLLGANIAATNAYTTAEKGATELQQLKASMLGASVDAYKNLAKSQTEAARLNKDLDSSYASLSRQADAYYASINKAQSAGNALNQSGERAEQYRKLGQAQAEAIRMNNEMDASNKRLERDQGKAIIEDKARALKALAAAEREEIATKQKMNTLEVAAAKEAEDFVRTLKRQADQVGMTHKQIKEYNAELLRTKAAALGVTAQTEAHITALKNAKGPHESFNLLTAGSARELMVLGHELSQGQMQRFGGSLIVLAERVNFLPSLLEKASEGARAMGVGLGTLVTGVLAAVAATVMFVMALIKGGTEQRAFNNALTLTGNFAGTTGAALNEMAHAAVATGGSLGEAKKAVLELANSGKFTADQIEHITHAAIEMEHATGKSVTSTVKEFEELATLSVTSTSRSTNAISQHIMKLNDHYHFLTAEQFNQISMLEKSGQAQEAAAKAEEFYANALITRSEKIKTELGSISRAWHFVKEAAGSAWDAMLGLGKKADPLDTVKSKIADYKSMLETMDNRPKWISGNGQGGGAQKQFDEGRLRIVQALSAAQIELAKAEYNAFKVGEDAQQQQRSIHAQDRERTIRETYDRHQKATRELVEFDKDWDEASEAYKTQNLAGHLVAREAMIKRSQETIAKVKGIGLSGLDAANKEIEAEMEVKQRGFDNEIRLIEMQRKYKQINETDAANQKDAILNKEYETVTALYEKEIRNAEAFHSKDVRLMNDAQVKKFGLMEKLGKFQSDMQLRMDQNSSKEIKAANESEVAAQQAFEAQSKTLDKEIDALHDKQRAYDLLPKAMRAAGVTEKQMQDLATQGAIDRLEYSKLDDTLGAAEIARINTIIKKLKEKRDAQAAVEVDQHENKIALEAPARLKAAATEQSNLWKQTGTDIKEALTSAFGAAGTAAGNMFKAFADGQADQIELSQKIAEAKKRELDSGLKETKLIGDLQSKQSAGQINTYADMAGAAKKFFKEGSTGYKAMAAVEKAVRVAGLAEQVAEYAVKSGLLAAFTGLFVTQKAVQVGVEATATTASVGMAGAQSSAWGIVAVVKALASLPFPFNLAAGAITLAAVIAIGAKMFGGVSGGSASVSEQRQQTQGTGSVLGDANAKSESIAHSLTIMEKNSGLGLAQGSSMVNYLKIVSESIQGLAGIVVGRTSTITSGPVVNNPTNIFAKLGNSIFGGKRSVEDTGIMSTATSLSSVLANGIKANQYADMKKDGGWFSSDKHWTDTSSLGTEANAQFSKIIVGMAASIKEASKALGLSGDGFESRLNSFIVDIGKISLKGMTGDDVQKALEAVFSKLGDDMARFAVTGLDKFQKVGEGYLETVIRISNDLMQVRDVFAVLDKTFALTGIAAVNVSESLIEAAGGLDKLTSGTKYFVDNFLTEAERMGPITNSVAKRLQELNLADVTTIELFKKKVRQLDITNVADQKLYASLLELAPAFKEVMDYSDKLAEGTEDLTAAQKKALKVVEDARSKLEKAYDSESNALQSTIDKTKSYITTLKDFPNSLKLGANSPLTNMEKYAEARDQFNKVSLAAKGGDAAAQQKFTSIANEFLNASKIINASGAGYTADFNSVQSMTSNLVDAAINQVDVATASLTALNKQVEGLISIDKSVMTVTQAISELSAAILAGKSAGLSDTSMGVINPVVVAKVADNSVLVEAIAKLTAQVSQQQTTVLSTTGVIVGAIHDAADTSADKIVEGVSSGGGSGKSIKVNLV